ncbi:hypothetical protein BT93_L0723 [Corymbia citriodora subsp. variegata]|uniref:Phosphotransferase n=1 Tax=Corymbia citriodora subsp. variegata TaxID=360336 RepID=A0A8T0CI38_CORYI|nr:hypothetical protein BT93_L0723 [Corymbia citriodora subsp. variegata]
MAVRIKELLADTEHSQEDVIPVGIAWSFPIEQTSHYSGNIQPMGKGFHCHEGIIGEDLANLIESACHQKNLNVRVRALINDSAATLLCNAYQDRNTTIGLILGTGTNAAIHVPFKLIGLQKFGMRSASWYQQAQDNDIVVNTELSMFGKGILYRTEWDETLNAEHRLPDFQPLEYMTTGRYLGEIFRLILIDAINDHGLFAGRFHAKLYERYSIPADVLAGLEEAALDQAYTSSDRIQSSLGLHDLSRVELEFLAAIAAALSCRAAAYIALAIHALWSLRPRDCGGMAVTQTTVAVDGYVICEYPNFRAKCQNYIQALLKLDPDAGHDEIYVKPCNEASILGAAAAVAIADVA